MIKKLLSIALLSSMFTSIYAQKDNDHNDAKPRTQYGNNILRISPIKVLDINGVGFGVEYEHIFNNGVVGVNIPLSLLFNPNNDYYGYINQNQQNTYFYISPGLKIYPMGQRKVTYAIGPTLFAGFGKTNFDRGYYDQFGKWHYEVANSSNFRLGMLIMNYFNVNISKSFNLGVDAGFGIRYIDAYFNPNSNDNLQPTGQFSFTFGYRF